MEELLNNRLFIGVVGIVIGALLTATLNFLQQRAADNRRFTYEERMQNRRWEREDQRLFHAERIQAYKEFHRAVTAYTYERDAPSKRHRDPDPERVDELATKLIHAYSDVYTFASAPVANAAKDLLDVALGGRANIADARLTFLERAQEELGVRVEPPDS